jgi:hypothetical protein
LSGPGHLLRDSAAIALGKLIYAHPVYADRLPRFINVWCLALSRITDPEQKLNALRALWVVVNVFSLYYMKILFLNHFRVEIAETNFFGY